MSFDSPVVIIYDSNNKPLAVLNNASIPINTSGIISMGSDGSNSRYITVDSSGKIVVVGSGVAGSPSGGVLTVQGIAGGTAVPISCPSGLSISGIIKPLYGTANQPITITIASLTTATARASTVIDNTTSLFEDILFFVKVTSASSGTLATGYVNIYGYGTVDNNIYPEAITGTDATVTLSSPPNLVLLAQITVNANSKTYYAGPFSFCRMYGLDRLPIKWGLVLVNQSGATLNATADNHAITYQGINGQIV